VEPIEIAPGRSRIGWIGTGVMGASMCGHLVAAGYDTTVWTRSPAKAEGLLAQGARWSEGAAALAERSDVVFTMLGFPHDVESVLLGDGGVFAGARPGTIVVDMTTSDPALAVELGRRGEALGLRVLDAPVSGGDVGARTGALSIMVGGPEAAFDAVRPALDLLGRNVVLQGGHGAGQHTKLVNQTLVAANIVGVCEALLYASRAGLDIERVLSSVSSGAAGSWTLSNLAPRIVAGDFAPGFLVDHFVKDMTLVLAEAGRMRVSMPGLALVHQLYVALQARGHGRDGTQALIHALGALSDIDWPPGGGQSSPGAPGDQP
jgi:3-hydroxyisobutyrate dehydrogenase